MHINFERRDHPFMVKSAKRSRIEDAGGSRGRKQVLLDVVFEAGSTNYAKVRDDCNIDGSGMEKNTTRGWTSG
jgi:hypothetical protein